MNIDLLTKLVKLANNNPNENEANLAARKVCRLIEDAKFKFNNDINPKLNIKSPETWNDIIRSEEPIWSSKRPNSTAPDFSNSFWEYMQEQIRKDQAYWSEFKTRAEEEKEKEKEK